MHWDFYTSHKLILCLPEETTGTVSVEPSRQSMIHSKCSEDVSFEGPDTRDDDMMVTTIYKMTPHSSGRDGAIGRNNPRASMAEHAKQSSPSHNMYTRH